MTREKISSKVLGSQEERKKRKAQEERLKAIRLQGETRGVSTRAYWEGYYSKRYPRESLIQTFGLPRLLGDRPYYYRPRVRRRPRNLQHMTEATFRGKIEEKFAKHKPMSCKCGHLT